MTTYPVGTNVRDIQFFDRSTKVIFECKVCKETTDEPIHYSSKDPFASQMFPLSEKAQRISYQIEPDPCPHTLKDDVWVTAFEYTNDEDAETQYNNQRNLRVRKSYDGEGE